MDIVTFGEALIDFKPTGPLAFQGYVGGSPLNVAVAAARLGARVGFATQISTDTFGLALREHVLANGIDLSLVLESDAPTSLAFVSEVDGEAHFDFIAGAAADTLYDPQPRPELPGSVKFIEFGSISLLKEPAATAILETVSKHRGRCTTVFDPNVRPALIPDRGVYLKKLEGWLALGDIVKASAQDLRWLYPGTSFEQVAHAWRALGPEVVIVTQGEAGVSLYRDQGALQVPVLRVQVVDTVGAGDTFTGALMVALLGKDLRALTDELWREALAFAAAAAAYNCTKAGAQPPTRRELEAFRQSR